MPEHFNKNKTINKIKVACKCSAFENIFSCNYLHCGSNSHFLLPDRRRRPSVEEKCKADLSRKDRGALESGPVEEVDWEVAGTRCSADTSRACFKTDGSGTLLLWATGPWTPPRVSFPSPCRWAWNVKVCCSKETKLSCTLSNCKQGEELWVLLRSCKQHLSVCLAYLLNVGLKQQLWPDRLAAAAHAVARMSVTPR